MSTNLWMALIATASFSVSLFSIFYSWWSSRQRATQHELDLLREKITEVDGKRGTNVGELRDRITLVEAGMRHMPTQQVAHNLAIRMEEMHGDMKGMQEALKGVQGQLETVNAFLIKGGNRQ